MSPELAALLEKAARAEQDALAEAKITAERHRMAYATTRQGLLATSTFTRPRQL